MFAVHFQFFSDIMLYKLNSDILKRKLSVSDLNTVHVLLAYSTTSRLNCYKIEIFFNFNVIIY